MARPIQETCSRPSRGLTVIAVAIAALVVGLALVARAPAEDLNGKLDAKQAELDQAKEKKGVLTTEISRYNDQIEQLTGEVAALRTREAAVQEELDQAEAELAAEQHDLRILRERLDRTVKALEDRLVDIYMADEPSAISVVLQSDGYDDALGRYEYLQRIQDRNSEIVGRVRELRDDTAATVERVRATRDSIAAKKAELVRTREQLQAREAQLDAARARSKKALTRIDGHVDHLESDVSDIQKKIQEQLAAASGVSPLPAGPIQGGSAGFIWPVNGPIVSGFGMRWGQPHEGVDIAVPAGTPIRAAKDGTIAFTQSEAESGGYGNYTCIDHGGGLATCYAHQSSFAITSGSVQQGDVIGYVGCTGHCFGDHLHFEVRINGTAVDPMGYL
ncbi:MAG TPA: peptidoglycan DD-metalloendopeptidase family protein [Solirubrobacterales bacterium]|jgi:murein DD-endopeptidase MepM/ murein hydrolase activator NlpD|nr:peptidoglycan DD-metalloendopeptidase family protein [Solirubrobacterales bacterium]